MAVQVMAAADPGELESQRLNRSGEVRESYIGEFALSQLLEQPSWIHTTNVGHGCDTHVPSSGPRGGNRVGEWCSGLAGVVETQLVTG